MEVTVRDKRADRLHRIFTLLLANQFTASNVTDAYLFLVECFSKIEKEFCPPDSKPMFLAGLKDFTHLKDYSLYKWAPHKHVVFIHENGAYAIYDKHSDHFDVNHCELYKSAKPCVKILNVDGKGIW